MNSPEKENIAGLITGCKRGSRSSQYRIYLLYSDSMFSICKRFIDNDSDAEEILQDSFVKAFTKIKKLKDDSKFGSWLKRITINECINFLKRKRIFYEEFTENTLEAAVSEDKEFDIDPEILKNEIKKLPDGCRIVFNLYLIEDYKHKEIAKILKISESTSKSQYQRAKQLLKSRLR